MTDKHWPPPLDPSTFEYLKPTDQQIITMSKVRATFKRAAEDLATLLPDGADKTYVMRTLRTAAMWANVSITRQADGRPWPDPHDARYG